MTIAEVVAGFVLAVTFLLSVAGAVFGWLAWRETKKTRPALAQGLRVMADLVEQQAKAVHVDPTLTGAPTLRAIAADAESGTAAMVRRPRVQEGPRKVRMRPLTDREEWAVEQEQRGFEGLPDGEVQKAKGWLSKMREERLTVATEE